MSKLFHPLRRIIYITLGIISRTLNLPGEKVIVLSYHSISDDHWPFSVSLDTFKTQINYLAGKYNFVTLAQINNYIHHRLPLPQPAVAITFDDGYQDILPIKNFLKQKNIRPTLFLMSEKKVNNAELGTDRAIMNNQQISDLIKAGWEIGSHTATHPDMLNLSNQQIKKEIVDSRKKLAKTLNCAVNYIAYPKGKYNSQILEAVTRAGYKLGLTVAGDSINQNTNPLTVSRIGIDRHHHLLEFKFLTANLVVKFRNFLRKFGHEI